MVAMSQESVVKIDRQSCDLRFAPSPNILPSFHFLSSIFHLTLAPQPSLNIQFIVYSFSLKSAEMGKWTDMTSLQ